MMRFWIIVLAAAAAAFALWHPAPRPAGFAVIVTAAGVPARALPDNAEPPATQRSPGMRKLHHRRTRAHKARSHRSARHRHTRRHRSRSRAKAAIRAVDVNHADAVALAGVPGLGPVLAQRIVAFRAANGPFATLDELLDVSGITPGRFDRAAPFLVLEGG